MSGLPNDRRSHASSNHHASRNVLRPHRCRCPRNLHDHQICGVGGIMLPAIFTLDVGGKPTLSFEAKNLREAWEICHEVWLKEDLASICSNGVPLWDGKASLRSRGAVEAEIAIYRQGARRGAKCRGFLFGS